MILCNLAAIMGERRLKISKVAADTGISRTTLTALYYDYGKGVQFDTANKLCEYLDVDMSELFIFAPVDYRFEAVEYNDGSHEGFVFVELATKQRTTLIKLKFIKGVKYRTALAQNGEVFRQALSNTFLVTNDFVNSEDQDEIFFYKTMEGMPGVVKEAFQRDLADYIAGNVSDEECRMRPGEAKIEFS